MKVDLKLTGADELAKALAQLPNAVSMKVQVQALKDAAKPMRDTMEALAPRGDDAPHMADNIRIGVASEQRKNEESQFDQAVVEVGPTMGFFYGFFQEFGTAFHPAQPFARPAFDTKVKESQSIIGARLWDAIRKHAAKMFKQQAASAGSNRAKSSGVGL